MSKTNRREFLLESVPLIAAPLLISLFPEKALAGPTVQGDWRYCGKCSSMFWNGTTNKGRCSAGGGHQAQGYDFVLPYGTLAETPTAQVSWRFCDKCYAMFFDGFADKGRCPAGGGHHAQGFVFRLPHDINADGGNQGNWRYCQKCKTMFYDGFPGKGNCPAGGGHQAQGYAFVLPHGAEPSRNVAADLHLRSGLSTDGWAPISGWVDIVMKPNGDYVFSGHVHNAGAVNIRYSLAAVVATPSGQSFGFGIKGHRVDGTETVFGRNRDHNWSQAKNDPRIARSWDSVAQGTLSWRLAASATITSTIEKFIDDTAREAFQKLAQRMNVSPGGQAAKFYMNLLLTL